MMLVATEAPKVPQRSLGQWEEAPNEALLSTSLLLLNHLPSTLPSLFSQNVSSPLSSSFLASQLMALLFGVTKFILLSWASKVPKHVAHIPFVFWYDGRCLGYVGGPGWYLLEVRLMDLIAAPTVFHQRSRPDVLWDSDLTCLYEHASDFVVVHEP